MKSAVKPEGSGPRVWTVGGSLLIAAAIVDAVVQPLALAGAGAVGTFFFSASMLLFALGYRGTGSVSGRHISGTAALIVLAGWMLLGSVLVGFHIVAPATRLAAGTLNDLDSLVRLIASVIAVAAIGRAGAIPQPWNWAPAWAVAALVALWVADRLSSFAGQDAASFAFALGALDGLVHIGAPIFLGVLAIVLANRSARTLAVPLVRD